MSDNFENKILKDDDISNSIFDDIDYICDSTPFIIDSLRRGLDVAQLPNGDVIVTEVKSVNTQHSWDRDKQRMIKSVRTKL